MSTEWVVLPLLLSWVFAYYLGRSAAREELTLAKEERHLAALDRAHAKADRELVERIERIGGVA